MTKQVLNNLSANAPSAMASATISTTSAELQASAQMDLADVQDWLAERVAEQLGTDADEIETNRPFHSYGLDSVQAMAIATQGKQRFGLEISPLVIWNCPTIESLSEHIVKEIATDDSDLFEI